LSKTGKDVLRPTTYKVILKNCCICFKGPLVLEKTSKTIRQMINSALKRLGYPLLGAALCALLFLPLLAEGQIENPTSSFPLPTSTISEPIPAADPDTEPLPPGENPPQIFASQVPYPYPAPFFEPQTTRMLYYVATFLMLAGILMLSGTLGRALGPFARRPAATKGKRF
jgi:hypothetical protein